MAGKGRPGQSWKNGYSNYKAKGQYEKNRARGLERHVAANPTDAVAEKAMGKIKYRRKTPTNKGGWANNAFKNESKEFKSSVTTKSARAFWAMALKLRKTTVNEMQHLPKSAREKMQQDVRAVEAKREASAAKKR